MLGPGTRHKSWLLVSAIVKTFTTMRGISVTQVRQPADKVLQGAGQLTQITTEIDQESRGGTDPCHLSMGGRSHSWADSRASSTSGSIGGNSAGASNKPDLRAPVAGHSSRWITREKVSLGYRLAEARRE
jgi:hypothetical protein